MLACQMVLASCLELNPRQMVYEASDLPLGHYWPLTENCSAMVYPISSDNHLAEVVRSKPGRPVYRGKLHIPPHFWAFLGLCVAYPCKIIVLTNKHIPQ